MYVIVYTTSMSKFSVFLYKDAVGISDIEAEVQGLQHHRGTGCVNGWLNQQRKNSMAVHSERDKTKQAKTNKNWKVVKRCKSEKLASKTEGLSWTVETYKFWHPEYDVCIGS